MNKSEAPRVIVAGGGTGGHLFPGIALAEEIRQRFPAGEVLFVGAGGFLEVKALADRHFPNALIHCRGLKGKSVLRVLFALALLPWSLWEAVRIIRRFRPDLVFGVGGYAAGPVVLGARILGIPTCIHEQNSVPGVTNRMLGRVVDRVFISIPGSEHYFPEAKCLLTGNPVRFELLTAPKAVLPKKTVCLLVLGGSQGAHRVNILVTEAMSGCRGDLPGTFMIIHQTGKNDESWVRAEYERLGIQARVAAFIDDMAEVYRQADLVVSRAGATTIAEITVMGKPAILIPFPFATDDHQTKNGRYLVRSGAALMFNEKELSGEILGREIIGLLTERGKLEDMGKRTQGLARPGAAAAIINECVVLSGQGSVAGMDDV